MHKRSRQRHVADAVEAGRHRVAGIDGDRHNPPLSTTIPDSTSSPRDTSRRTSHATASAGDPAAQLWSRWRRPHRCARAHSATSVGRRHPGPRIQRLPATVNGNRRRDRGRAAHPDRGLRLPATSDAEGVRNAAGHADSRPTRSRVGWQGRSRTADVHDFSCPISTVCPPGRDTRRGRANFQSQALNDAGALCGTCCHPPLRAPPARGWLPPPRSRQKHRRPPHRDRPASPA
jgi:hypothetical protein